VDPGRSAAVNSDGVLSHKARLERVVVGGGKVVERHERSGGAGSEVEDGAVVNEEQVAADREALRYQRERSKGGERLGVARPGGAEKGVE